MPRPILLCTVGTSLFFPNLAGLRRALVEDASRPDDAKTVRPALRPRAEELVWVVTALDQAGLEAGVRALRESDLRDAFAVATTGRTVEMLPLR